MSWARQIAVLALAFAGGTATAALFGAVDLGIALGVGQICFAAALAWVLLA